MRFECRLSMYIMLMAALALLCAAWLQFSWMHGFLPMEYFPMI